MSSSCVGLPSQQNTLTKVVLVFGFLYLLVLVRAGTPLLRAGFLSLRGAGSPRHRSAGASQCGVQSSRVRGLQQFLRVRQSLQLAGSRAQAKRLSCSTAWDPP